MITARRLAFILASTEHGTMIINRFDSFEMPDGAILGVGHEILEASAYEPFEVELILSLADLRRKHHGDGVMAIDCGANIGVHTVELAKHMTGWGQVIAIEAQERIFYALAGNIAIGNYPNARAIHAAVGATSGMMKIPVPDYFSYASFGDLELKRTDLRPQSSRQGIDYTTARMIDIRALRLDELKFPRLDLIKIDVEGMEMEVMEGAGKNIEAHRPIIKTETVKLDVAGFRAWLGGRNYSVFQSHINLIAVHNDDPCLTTIALNCLPL
jgi:FkbM family methyltransferase